jgi:hypothetical protein
MSFYDDIAAMAAELLAPEADGGLGQGSVVLIRTTPGTPDPEEPWVAVVPTTETETLRAVVSGAAKFADGVTILATDLRIVAAVPVMDWRMGSDVLSLTIDGRPATIVRARGIPAAGTPAAIEFIARS